MFRGIEQFSNDYETIWGWLFNNKNINSTIELIAEEDETNTEILTINLSSESYDFTYHRLERINNILKVISYDQETINTSVEMDFEMR